MPPSLTITNKGRPCDMRLLRFCAIIVVLIPFSLMAMRRTQVLEITDDGIILLS